MYKWIIAGILLLAGNTPTAMAQIRKKLGQAQTHYKDTSQVENIAEFFTKGAFHGHVRNFFMATLNHRQLSDNYANATGAELAYKTANFHGFQIGFSGLFTFKTFSSGLDSPDPLTHKFPRLELELFDIEDHENHHDLDRLDELHLEYHNHWIDTRIGRISLYSPLINPQDARMKPYITQGIHTEMKASEHLSMHLAYLNAFSPRGTVRWFSLSESIGVYPTGLDAQGEPRHYAGHTEPGGVWLAGLRHDQPNYQAELWHYLIDNVSHTSYSRVVLKPLNWFKIGVEGLLQQQAGSGGNTKEALRYFNQQKSWLAGATAGLVFKHFNTSVNYLHIGDQGRFIFPREWGREQFFVTVPRGRLEGLAATDALMLHNEYSPVHQWHFSIDAGRVWTPPADAFAQNANGQVSYWNFIADVHYEPDYKGWRGLSFRLLYVLKHAPDAAIPLEQMYYLTNFHHFSFVSQVHF